MKVHLLGIGGVGMYAIAVRLMNFGLQISGSDIQENDFTCKLLNKGVSVYINNTPLSVIEESDVIIYSSAIKDGDKNLDYAKKLNKCICSRAEVLGDLFKGAKLSVGVAGSHGKTTATCMIASVLNINKNPFTAFIGGEDLNLGSFVNKGDSILLSEVCEYERNIRYITPKISLLLNIDDDHLDTYKTLNNLKTEFFSYLDRSRIKIINNDDKLLSSYSSNSVITYSINTDSNYKAYDIVNNGGKYSFKYKDKSGNENLINLNVYGYHNIYNALGAIAVCESLNILPNTIKIGLESFRGVKRRFEFLGELFGKNIIADYCHHPSEISSTLKTAKSVFDSDYLTVFQPHTYSRTKLLFNKFISVLSGENAVIFKEYSARENYDYLGSASRLSKRLKNSIYIEDLNGLLDTIKTSKKNNILILGAGNLYDKIKKYTKNYTVW